MAYIVVKKTLAGAGGRLLVPGREVTDKDFSGGAATLAKVVARGAVVDTSKTPIPVVSAPAPTQVVSEAIPKVGDGANRGEAGVIPVTELPKKKAGWQGR